MPEGTFGPTVMDERDEHVTRILSELDSDARPAAAQFLPQLYDELHRLAVARFRAQPAGHTLQPTALVHEAYAKLAESPHVAFKDSRHFLTLASKVMRQILVDHARAKATAKRSNRRERLTLSDQIEDPPVSQVDLLALEEALNKLATLDARKAQLVELRFFGGLTEPDAAGVLGISRTEASRWWRTTRAWLAQELRDEYNAP
jgi:RNA polymerase sigma factor (TIGR02999 family)